ncbi:hypothetical protein F5Y16DRAFT_423144 [Xylariaceae sp. FL0255]|nr:hypothetical protein F5Y16DRAFT_423144 [Xylariaceae sp. FL0255]
MGDKTARWWMPGPPPPRRSLPLRAVKDGMPALDMPIRHMHVLLSNLDDALGCYVRQLEKLATASEMTPVFHGCGTLLTPDIVASFAHTGPSIHYSRSQGYFSTGPAVYWSNSLRFATAWCFFTQTGSWKLEKEDKDKPLNCLIYVSLINLAMIPFERGIYMVPNPQTRQDEEALSNWCISNMSAANTGENNRIAPPGATRSDWGVIGSRIPLETWHSMKNSESCIDQVWIGESRVGSPQISAKEWKPKLTETARQILLLTIE